jgi:hypothetical protein
MTIQAKERPAIFSGWSVCRMWADEKIQTRRIIKPQPPSDVFSVMRDSVGDDWIGTIGFREDPIRWSGECPFGEAGDILWVREAFRLPASFDDKTPREYVEMWDHAEAAIANTHYCADRRPDEDKGVLGRKRSPIYMPRELCRLRLRVQSIRAERLLDIDEGDAMAEGVEPVTRRSASVHGGDTRSAVIAFKERWNEIHGRGSWQRNPWVWVVTFTRLDEKPWLSLN